MSNFNKIGGGSIFIAIERVKNEKKVTKVTNVVKVTYVTNLAKGIKH